MELIEVEAVEDRTRADGGHAVILLRDVDVLPEVVKFKLRPVDADGISAEARQFFEKEHEPLSTHLTEGGIALTIGPEIADNPALVQGAAVDITLAAAGLRGEFLWPAITPLARPKRRNIMARRTASDPLPRPAIVAPVAAAGGLTAVADNVREQPTATTTTIVAAAPVVPKADVQPGRNRAEHRPPPAPFVPREEAEPAPEPAIVVIETRTVPAVASDVAVVPVVDATPVPHSEETPRIEPRERRVSAGSAAVMSVALLILGQIVALRALDMSIMKRATTAATVVSSVPAKVASATVQQASSKVPDAGPNVGIFEVIASGPQSPRGLTAAEVSPAKALQLAHTYMHGPEAGRDTEEAIYWLKRFLLSTTGTEHSRIALTQLGSAYAQPARGAPDLARASIAWELAAAWGDSVAMCFLGALHEHGLGTLVAMDKAQAWYGRAERAGGHCVSVTSKAATGQR